VLAAVEVPVVAEEAPAAVVAGVAAWLVPAAAPVDAPAAATVRAVVECWLDPPHAARHGMVITSEDKARNRRIMFLPVVDLTVTGVDRRGFVPPASD
jgi:hypothetical protein